MPDVTIIGAGPAGSTAAILLARGGWDVTLVEQSRFPRDKVCGECLSALGLDVLARLGLADRLREAGALRLDACEVHAPSGRALSVRLPCPMWGISRHALDGLLLDAAREAGVTVRQPMRCEGIDTESRPTVRLRDLVTNAIETHRPSHVIVADGKAALLGDTPTATGDFGIKTHFADVDGPRDRIELFGVHGSYGGLAPIEAARWNAAFSVPAARLKSVRGDLDALFAELKSENRALDRRLVDAQRVGPWLAAPLPRFAVRKRWPATVTPVGNAAAALEPIGGEGMGLAIRSAELAASALLAGASTAGALRLEGTYQKLWRVRRAGCRAAAVTISSPSVAEGLLVLGGLPGPIARTVMRMLGKTNGPPADLTPQREGLPRGS